MKSNYKLGKTISTVKHNNNDHNHKEKEESRLAICGRHIMKNHDLCE